MKTKHSFWVLLLVTALVVTCLVSTVFAQLTVGVKKGDMMEYQVEGRGDVPEQHDHSSATIEVANVGNKTIDINFTSIFLDGTEKLNIQPLIWKQAILERHSLFQQTLLKVTRFLNKSKKT